MANAHTIAFEVATSGTEYHAIGPFTTNQLLTWLILHCSAESDERVLIAPVLHQTSIATAATIAAGIKLITTAETQLAGANALLFRTGTAGVTPLIIPLNVQPVSSPTWVHLATGNLNAAHILYVVASVSAHPAGLFTHSSEPPVAPAPPA